MVISMLKPSDMIVSNESLGKKFLLVEVRPKYEYVGNQRTDKVTGFGYTIVLPERSFERLVVRIDGKQQIESPDSYVEVTFVDLELYIFWSQGQYTVGARASGIRVVNNKT